VTDMRKIEPAAIFRYDHHFLSYFSCFVGEDWLMVSLCPCLSPLEPKIFHTIWHEYHAPSSHYTFVLYPTITNTNMHSKNISLPLAVRGTIVLCKKQ